MPPSASHARPPRSPPKAATDGVYVIRTSLPAETCDDATTVRSYKSLALVERALSLHQDRRCCVRPVYHRLADRVRAHVFLCMLAYYLEWHMRQRLQRRCCSTKHRQGGRRSHAFERGGDRAALTEPLSPKQTTRLTPERFAGAQLPLAARRSRDLGAQHCHHRHHTKLSAHHTDQANSDPAQGVHPPWRPSVASNTTRQ